MVIRRKSPPGRFLPIVPPKKSTCRKITHDWPAHMHWGHGGPRQVARRPVRVIVTVQRSDLAKKRRRPPADFSCLEGTSLDLILSTNSSLNPITLVPWSNTKQSHSQQPKFMQVGPTTPFTNVASGPTKDIQTQTKLALKMGRWGSSIHRADHSQLNLPNDARDKATKTWPCANNAGTSLPFDRRRKSVVGLAQAPARINALQAHKTTNLGQA